MGTGIGDILEPEEKVVWQGVINRGMLAFYFVLFLVPILALGVWGLTQDTIGLQPCGRYELQETCSARPILQVSGVWFGVILIGIGLVLLLINYLWQLSREYTVTSKRIIIKSWAMRNWYQFIYLGEIKNVLDTTGWLGKKLGFGTIKIDTGAVYANATYMIRYTYLPNVTAPGAAYAYLQSAIANNKQNSEVSLKATDVTNKGTHSLFWKVCGLLLFIFSFVTVLWPQVRDFAYHYQQDSQAQVQGRDNIKIERGQNIANTLQVDKQISGKYPDSLQDSTFAQTTREILKPDDLKLEAKYGVALGDFSYQPIDQGKDFRLCITLSIGQKCWTEADI